ncbi:MAG: hypothetical protein WD696_22365 [Bryobacteraceae bacterium]
MSADASSTKDHLAAEVVSRWVEFQTALSDKRKYPLQQFRSLADVTRRYVQATRDDALIHRSVVEAINGLTDFLTAERKHVPQDVLSDAERLECLVFGGYDPHFEGDEPPGL